MTKVLIGAVVGIFIGAFAFEILKKKNPKFLKAIEEQANSLATTLTKAVGEWDGGPSPVHAVHKKA
jgi:uncharacterized membrane-anchored protein YhcB (DUF1043 family)